jgi:hypothetical protein
MSSLLNPVANYILKHNAENDLPTSHSSVSERRQFWRKFQDQ